MPDPRPLPARTALQAPDEAPETGDRPGRRDPILWLISLGFVGYAAVFIWRSSFVCIDGARYFSLFDDAMISMRYAWNWVHGLGLVWNPGEYVEGYTNPLMVALMAIPNWIFEERRLAVLSIQVLGAGSALGIAWLSGAVARRLAAGGRVLAGRLAFLAALLYYPMIYWTLMGMEVGLVTLAVLGMLLAGLGFARDGRPGWLMAAGGLAALGYLSRPDTLVPCGILALFLTVELFRKERSYTRALLLLAGPAAMVLAVIGAHLAFRYGYYGELLPNTYVLKMEGMPPGDRLLNGLGFTWPFLLSAGPLLLVAAVAVGRRFDRWRTAVGAAALGMILYQIYVGGDGWTYWRMLTPAVALLLPLAVAELVGWFSGPVEGDRMAGFLGRLASRPRGRSLAAVGGCLLVLLVLNLNFLTEAVGLRPIYQVDSNRYNVDTALLLRQVATPKARIGVFWAGSLPYYSGLYAVDFLGKSDPHIARLEADLSGRVGWNGMNSVPGHNKYDLGYSIATREPDYVQGLAWGRQNLGRQLNHRYLSLQADEIHLILNRHSQRIRWRRLCTLLGRPPGCQHRP